MKKIIVGIILVTFLSGCASINKFFGSKDGRPAEITIQKREAIRLSREYLQGNGFDDEFSLVKPSKISRRLSMEKNSRWVWLVYFPSKSRKFWKFWKRSPIMVELYADTGEVRYWGRR